MIENIFSIFLFTAKNFTSSDFEIFENNCLI